MSKFAVFDNNGFPIAFYDSNINKNIPSDAIPITESQWLEFINNQGKRRWNFEINSIEEYVPPVDLDKLKSDLIYQLKILSKQRIEKILDIFGYITYETLRQKANQNDTTAQKIQDWILDYSNRITNNIDSIRNETSQTVLESMDIRLLEKSIFEESIANVPI